MDFVGFKVEFKEHVMSNYYSEGRPIQGCLLYSWLKQIRVVTNLLQSHQYIHNSSTLMILIPLIFMPNHLIIQIFLSSTHSTSHNRLCFLRKLSFYIFFQSSQEKWPQDCMQFFQDFLTNGEIFLKSFLKRDIKPFIEIIE